MNIQDSGDSTIGDGSLLRRIVDGDSAAATRIFERHAPELLRIARKRLSAILQSLVDPEDIVQSTFKSFFRRAKSGGYVAPKSGDLLNLLIVISMRKINSRADYLTAKRRDVRKTQSADATIRDRALQTNDTAMNELCLTIAEILEEFSQTQQAIVAMRLEGRTIKEIAERCQRSNRTVERELQAFRVRLSREYEP